MLKFLCGLLDWIYKKKCYFCKSSKDCAKMCSSCYSDLDFLPHEVNRNLCGVNVYCAGIYASTMQKLIRGVKYHNQRDLAYFQALFMWEYFKQIKFGKKYQVVPVPLHKSREKKRKYNHMTLVAQELCKLSGYELNLGLIKRIKNTKPQYKLKRSERLLNLANAFEVDKTKLIVDLPILIIDDICTTGSTFESMIVELKKNNINDITCLATATVE